MRRPRVAGLLLAAGAGRRYGLPKALAGDPAAPWVVSTVSRMRTAGCDPILVVIGAAADAVSARLPVDVIALVNPEWATGMASSLRAGLIAAARLQPEPVALLVMLVDLPGVTAAAMATVVNLVDDNLVGDNLAGDNPFSAGVLAQADYDGSPGHPVLLGRDHWAPLAGTLSGDAGGREYLSAHGAARVPLARVADGTDVDRRA